MDFGARTASGTLSLTLVCFMGCSYPNAEHRITNIRWNAGENSFRGDIPGLGGQPAGTVVGSFAGPGADELMLAFDLSFYDPNYGDWRATSGIVLARVG